MSTRAQQHGSETAQKEAQQHNSTKRSKAVSKGAEQHTGVEMSIEPRVKGKETQEQKAQKGWYTPNATINAG